MEGSTGFGATGPRRSFVLALAGAAGILKAESRRKGAVMPEDSLPSGAKATGMNRLKWDMLVTPSVPVVTTDLAPGESERPWPPISSTLIYGDRDAVVVDSFITVHQALAQADWIAAKGKNLTMIYATHGHGDHSLGQLFFLIVFRVRALSLYPARFKL